MPTSGKSQVSLKHKWMPVSAHRSTCTSSQSFKQASLVTQVFCCVCACVLMFTCVIACWYMIYHSMVVISCSKLIGVWFITLWNGFWSSCALVFEHSSIVLPTWCKRFLLQLQNSRREYDFWGLQFDKLVKKDFSPSFLAKSVTHIHGFTLLSF